MYRIVVCEPGQLAYEMEIKPWKRSIRKLVGGDFDCINMGDYFKTIIVTHKDRFIRFGYEWFEKFCLKFNTVILLVNNEGLSPQEELVQDIVSILHVFSCRLYGLRKYKKQIKEGITLWNMQYRVM
jgi:predicted site-specific integrase-resolvase